MTDHLVFGPRPTKNRTLSPHRGEAVPPPDRGTPKRSGPSGPRLRKGARHHSALWFIPLSIFRSREILYAIDQISILGGIYSA